MSLKLGKKILQRMAELGIKTNRQLADKMNADDHVVHPYTIGKWIAGKSSPRGDKLIALARALNISVDLLVLEEGHNPEELKIVRDMVRDIVRSEIKRLPGTATGTPQNQLSRFFNSSKIPEEQKKIILSLIDNLLKVHGEEKSE